MIPPVACCTLMVADVIFTGKVTVTSLPGLLRVTDAVNDVRQSNSRCSEGWLFEGMKV